MLVNKKIIASVIAMSLGFQASFGFAATQEAKATGYAALVGSQEGNSDKVASALSDAQANIGMGMSPDKAIQGMVGQMVSSGVSLSDIDSYVQENSTYSDYAAFRESLDKSFQGIDPTQMSQSELSQAMNSAILATKTEGLAWNACSTVTTGAIFAVAAVIVGIIALADTKGVGRVKKNYTDKRANRTNQYNNDTAYYQNIETNLQNQISANTSKRATAEANRSYWEGKMDAYASIGDTADYNAAKGNRDQAASDVAYYNNQISAEQSELNGYVNNPSLKAAKLAQLTTDYNADIASLNAEEQRKIDLVPQNNATAKTLGYVTAGLAVPAAVMIASSAGACSRSK